MIAPTAPPVLGSPLSRLGSKDREQVIAALTARLPHHDAVAVLTALAGSPEELTAVPFELQGRAQDAILDALPPAHNAVVASVLGIAMQSDEENLEAILTEQEKADPVFRRRVELMAHERGIQRWLAAVKVRHAHMSLDEIAETVQRRQREHAQGGSAD